MAHGSTWYRDETVHDFFDRLRDQGFFRQFDRVVFYGTSMGGYAACAFSLAVMLAIFGGGRLIAPRSAHRSRS